MNVATLIGWRYYRSRSGNRFVSLVSAVSFLGLVLGVVALIVVVSVMNGFDRELKQRILGAAPHVVVAGATVPQVEKLVGGHPEVRAIAPFREAPVLLLAQGASHLLSVYGLVPEREHRASSLAGAFVNGSMAALDGKDLELAIGDSIARRFDLQPGDAVNLVAPGVSASGETIVPRLFRARIVGSFALGSQLDYSLALMHVADLGLLTGEPAGVRLTLADIFAAPVVSESLRAEGLQVIDWTHAFGDFFRAVRMEKVMMFILLSFVVAVASFSIVSGLTMLVQGKRRDIAVLMTMGLSGGGVLRVFLVQGLSIAVLGVSFGLLLGIPLAHYTPEMMGLLETWFGFSIIAGTWFEEIPTDVRALDVAVIALVTFIISFAATLYPAFRATRLRPAAILRYE